MVPNANARHFLLKAKQRDLIAAAGGIERAAAICSYSKSVVGRWNNPDSPEIMELPAIFALEEETGRFDLSEAIAQARGKRFADSGVEPAANASLMARNAAVAVQVGELLTSAALAFSDGQLTPNEAQQIDRTASKLEEALADFRKALAGARSAGGARISTHDGRGE